MDNCHFVTFLIFLFLLKENISVTPNRPNIILFFPDDMGYNDVSFTNGADYVPFKQPFLDSLAADGVTLSNYYSASLCTPARCSLMTGRYTIRSGCQSEDLHNGVPWGINLDEYLLSEMLKDAGYYTVLYGKWHLGYYAEKYLPTGRGFDEFIGYCGGGEEHYSHFEGPPHERQTYDWWYGLPNRNGEFQPAKPDYDLKYSGIYSTFIWNETMWDFVTRRSLNIESPWFMFLSSQLPHGPPQAPQEYANIGCKKTNTCKNPYSEYAHWLGMEYLLDDYVASVINAVKISGQLNNTIFIFAGDHGSPSIDNFMPNNITAFIPNYSRNYPFRGGKDSQYEGGVRCPAFVWSPLLPDEIRGKTLPDITSVLDWLPTIATWAGLSSSSLPNIVDGIDLTDRLFNEGDLTQRNLLININTLCQDDATHRMMLGESLDPHAALRYQNGTIDVKLAVGCMLSNGTMMGNISMWNMSYKQNELDINDLMKDKNWVVENKAVIDIVFRLLDDYRKESVPPLLKEFSLANKFIM